MKTCSKCSKRKSNKEFYNIKYQDSICIECRTNKREVIKSVPPKEFEQLIKSGLSRAGILHAMSISEYQYNIWMKQWKPSRDQVLPITTETLKKVWRRIETLCRSKRTSEMERELEKLTKFYSHVNLLDEQIKSNTTVPEDRTQSSTEIPP